MPTDESSSDRNERAILELLTDDGPLTTSQLADRLAAHPITIDRRCRELQRAGRVRRCPGGAFTIDDSQKDTRTTGD